MEAIEKPVWLKGSGLERIRDASYRHIDGERDGEIRDGREGRETEVETWKREKDELAGMLF